MKSSQRTWSSRIGIVLAVAGTAVGIGNFLRFPGQAAQFGGGAFMIAYFTSLVILGLPMGLMEWVMGRYGGRKGFNSQPGILSTVWKHPLAKYLGGLCVVTLLSLYCYYAYVESWCLGYAINFLNPDFSLDSTAESQTFFNNFLGASQHGAGLALSSNKILPFVLVTLILNFVLVYRGISKGIERFARYAVPSLAVIALIVLIRVLTLGTPNPEQPHLNINNGLGFMWNPTKTYLVDTATQSSTEVIGTTKITEAFEFAKTNPARFRIEEKTLTDQLKRPKLWLAAASQVFFSLALGFGAIMVYASYTRDDDDLVLSSLSAISANEFAEVALGGLISIPAAFAFLGTAGIVGQSIFGLGFNVLPIVFSSMPAGNLFGFLFFFLLFIASISGVLCMLQTGIAFFEETLQIERKRACVMTAALTLLGCGIVIFFSADIKAMDTFDFWVGNFLMFVISMLNILVFGWAMGPKKIWDEAHKGAIIRIPRFFAFVIRYLCPLFLVTIFGLWLALDVFGIGGGTIDYHIQDLFGESPSKVAWLVVSSIALMTTFVWLLISRVKRYK